MSDAFSLFSLAANRAAQWRSADPDAPIRPVADPAMLAGHLALPLPETGEDAEAVLNALCDAAEPGLMRMTSPRFFGWVVGGSHPAGVAADFLTSAWGQNTYIGGVTPAAAQAEKAVAGWLLDLLDLPRESSVGFVTGATMANFVCLAAARSHLYRSQGWDVEQDGLVGAPPIRIIAGDDAHASVFAALQYLGFGRGQAELVPTDCEGRMLAPALAAMLKDNTGPTLVIAQAGQINTGGIDPLGDIAAICRAAGAWLHVDGAFGLWARACPETAHLAHGADLADSWATDGHKWLQLPYDCGFAIVRDAEAHRRAMTISASYLPTTETAYDPASLTPELSRRARGFPAWAVIRTLGRKGIAGMIARHCRLARKAAALLRVEPGVRILNGVLLNQVIVDLAIGGPDRNTVLRSVVDAIHREDRVMVETANWRGRMIIRVSVISLETDDASVEALAASLIRAWRSCDQHPHKTPPPSSPATRIKDVQAS